MAILGPNEYQNTFDLSHWGMNVGIYLACIGYDLNRNFRPDPDPEPEFQFS
jgi:hypothetical protein